MLAIGERTLRGWGECRTPDGGACLVEELQMTQDVYHSPQTRSLKRLESHERWMLYSLSVGFCDDYRASSAYCCGFASIIGQDGEMARWRAFHICEWFEYPNRPLDFHRMASP